MLNIESIRKNRSLFGKNKHERKNFKNKLIKEESTKDIRNTIKNNKKIRWELKISKERFNLKYNEFKKKSTLLIRDSIIMLNKFKKNKNYKKTQYIFLDRDATPYQQIMRVIGPEFGFRKEQFNNILLPGKLRDKIYKMLNHKTEKNKEKRYYSHKSRSDKLINFINDINKIKDYKKDLDKQIMAFEKQKTFLKLNPKDPIIVVDSGIYGSSVKLTELLILRKYPNAKVGSALFYYSKKLENSTDFKIYVQDSSLEGGALLFENLPKFKGRLKSLKETKRKIKTMRSKSVTQINAKIFSIALGNMLIKFAKNPNEFKILY